MLEDLRLERSHKRLWSLHERRLSLVSALTHFAAFDLAALPTGSVKGKDSTDTIDKSLLSPHTKYLTITTDSLLHLSHTPTATAVRSSINAATPSFRM